MKTVDVISIANKLGRILLRSGAETSRAESMIMLVCKRFGLDAQCFVSMTGIITSVTTKDGNIISSVEKVKSISNNLNRIDRIHELVLNIEYYDFEEFSSILDEIEFEQVYSEPFIILSYFCGAGCFSLLFKGGIIDFIIAGIGGLLVYFVTKMSNKLKLNNFFINTFCGFLSTTFATIMYNIGIIKTPSYASIGTIMLLVPGLALTNAIRDLVNGDLISGVSRAVESFLIGTALGIGTGFSLFLLNFGG